MVFCGCVIALPGNRYQQIAFDARVERKIRTRLDLLSIPQSGGKNVKTFRWNHRLQIQNLFMGSPMVVTLGQQ